MHQQFLSDYIEQSQLKFLIQKLQVYMLDDES